MHMDLLVRKEKASWRKCSSAMPVSMVERTRSSTQHMLPSARHTELWLTATCHKNFLLYNKSGFPIRIHFLRIRIQRIRMEANTDPDPDPIRIQGFNDQKLKKNNSWRKNFFFFWSKTAIYLSLGLHKVCPGYRRSLQSLPGSQTGRSPAPTLPWGQWAFLRYTLFAGGRGSCGFQEHSVSCE